MRKLTPQDFDDWHRKNFEKELAAHPNEEGTVVGCIFDVYISGNKLTECSKCGIPLYMRSWLLEAAQKHNLKILCQFCIDPKMFRGRVIMDLAKIEQEYEQQGEC